MVAFVTQLPSLPPASRFWHASEPEAMKPNLPLFLYPVPHEVLVGRELGCLLREALAGMGCEAGVTGSA